MTSSLVYGRRAVDVISNWCANSGRVLKMTSPPANGKQEEEENGSYRVGEVALRFGFLGALLGRRRRRRLRAAPVAVQPLGQVGAPATGARLRYRRHRLRHRLWHRRRHRQRPVLQGRQRFGRVVLFGRVTLFLPDSII